MPRPPVDVQDFLERLLPAYEEGTADRELPADDAMAQSFMPPGTADVRDFWSMTPEIPEFLPASCVGCMECVTECPDTAILGKVVPEPRVAELVAMGSTDEERKFLENCWARPKKYADNVAARGGTPGRFGIFIDPAKCKGCGECVAVCGERGALRMIPKTDPLRQWHRRSLQMDVAAGPTPSEYILEKSVMDMMLAGTATEPYCGGAGSCMGCGEGTLIRMTLAATSFVHGAGQAGIVAATGCNTVFGSTYPYTPYRVPWTNSLFENACSVAMGVRRMWNRYGWNTKRLWVLGGDGAMYDIGFQSLSRMLASGMDIKVLVLDTQVYSNTGGQASTSTFVGQETKYTAVGSVLTGKSEARKELSQIALMHSDVFVAQTTASHPNHFYKAVMGANRYKGPALIVAYAACPPEHGIGDDRAYHQAKLAVECRAFPLFIHDPERGSSLRERLDLGGNPAPKEDWWKHPRTGEVMDFIKFARSEGRFARNFDASGTPGPALLAASADRLSSWRRLQELAGLR